MISRRFKLALASGGIVGSTIVAGFAPIVRHEAAQVAGRYGAALEIHSVVPTLHGVRLRGVDVSLEDVPSARIHLDEVEVAYGSDGRHVTLRGGAVSAVGPRETVLEQAEAWRAHLAASAGKASANGGGGGTEIAGFRLSWADSLTDPAETVTAGDVGIARTEGRVVLSAGEATVALGRTSFSVKNGQIELVRREAGGYGVGALTAAGVDAQVVLPVDPKPAQPDGPTLNLDRPPPDPPPLPPGAKGGTAESGSRGSRGRRSGKSRTARADVAPPPAPLPAPAPYAPAASSAAPGASAAYRSKLFLAAQAIDRLLEPGANVRLEGVRARIQRGAEVLNLGPGTLEVYRAFQNLVVDLSPELRAAVVAGVAAVAGGEPAPAAAREEALTFHLSVPLAPGEIAADVKGGPIWLSSLGIKEGDFGLFDVGLASLSTRSHLTLSADGNTLRIDGDARVHALSIKSAALSDEPVAGLELAVRLKGEVDLDGGRARVADSEVDLGAIHLGLRGDYDRSGDGLRFRGSFEMPLTSCQSMLDSTPKGLVPKLQGMRLAGSYALRGRADVDTARLDRGFSLDWDATNTCRVTEAPSAVAVTQFRAPFRRTAYDAEGRPVSLETGPGVPEWVPLTAISKFMEVAVLTTEDGAFHHHHGFDHEAIRNSVRENLRRRKFVRGASTLSMQLAKNLYLDRGKNLSRKLQEAVLTMYLEQELTKEQILELYLNVVEFGPMVYGVGPAAKHYFNTSAHDLSLGQSLYIATLLPNPKVQHFGAGGAVAPAWMRYLRRLMQIAHDRNNITDEELDEGLRETVVRGSPAPERAAKPITDGDTDLPPDLPDDGVPYVP